MAAKKVTAGMAIAKAGSMRRKAAAAAKKAAFKAGAKGKTLPAGRRSAKINRVGAVNPATPRGGAGPRNFKSGGGFGGGG